MFSAVTDQIDRKEAFEKHIFYQDCPQHLQVEEDTARDRSGEKVGEECAVQVEKDDEENSLVESHHVVLASSRLD